MICLLICINFFSCRDNTRKVEQSYNSRDTAIQTNLSPPNNPVELSQEIIDSAYFSSGWWGIPKGCHDSYPFQSSFFPNFSPFFSEVLDFREKKAGYITGSLSVNFEIEGQKIYCGEGDGGIVPVWDQMVKWGNRSVEAAYKCKRRSWKQNQSKKLKEYHYFEIKGLKLVHLYYQEPDDGKLKLNFDEWSERALKIIVNDYPRFDTLTYSYQGSTWNCIRSEEVISLQNTRESSPLGCCR